MMKTQLWDFLWIVMLIEIFVLYTVMLSQLSSVMSVTLITQHFAKTVRKNCGPQRLSSEWYSNSLLNCAITCELRLNKSCYCFMYNNTTQLCTPCAGLSPYSDPPNLQEGDLFYTDICDAYPDFRKYSIYPNETTYSSHILLNQNFSDATSTCDCLGAVMFTTKSLQRRDLFINITGLQISTWVGLSDMATEGNFVWMDDNLTIDPVLKKQLFSAGQPDNAGNVEDCVYMWTSGQAAPGKYNDGKCNLARTFVCEKLNC